MRTITSISILLILPFRLSCQDNEKSYALNGYLTNMTSVMFAEVDNDWIVDNLIHNRLNLHWYPSDQFSFSIVAHFGLQTIIVLNYALVRHKNNTEISNQKLREEFHSEIPNHETVFYHLLPVL